MTSKSTTTSTFMATTATGSLFQMEPPAPSHQRTSSTSAKRSSFVVFQSSRATEVPAVVVYAMTLLLGMLISTIWLTQLK